MSFYPFNVRLAKNAGQQTDTEAVVARAFVAHETWEDPAALNADEVLALTALPESGTLVVTEGITNPDYPRALRIVASHSGQTGNVVIAGTNRAGEAITETIALNGDTAVDGNKAFATVTQITLPERAEAGREVSVGFNNKLGLAYLLPTNTVLLAVHDGTRESTPPTVVAHADDLESNTVLLNTANDDDQVDVYYLV